MPKKKTSQGFNLKTVTPGAMKTLGDLGLLTGDAKKYGAAMVEIAQDPEKIKEVLGVIYDHDFGEIDPETFDVSIFVRGAEDFLQKFLNPTRQ